MNQLLSGLLNQFSDEMLSQMGQSLGADKNQAKSAVETALPLLMGALSKNVSNESGAQALTNALEKKHDGSVFAQIPDLLKGDPQVQKMLNGSGILKHVLGNNLTNAEKYVSQSSGLSSDGAGKVLQMAAPVLMGMLGQQKKEQNLDSSGISSLVNQLSGELMQNNPKQSSFIEKLLDADGDGSIWDDVLGMGLKFLGAKLFGR